MATHEIQPDISLFGKLGARSRALPMVVTELVDNSLDSWIALPNNRKGKNGLRIDISAGEGKNSWFTIKDNAGGMTEAELAKALTVAHSTKAEDKRLIGSFGFGLKSAAMYIGRRFQIYTCSHTDPGTIWYVDFDRDKFEKLGKWIIEIKKTSPSEASKADVYFPDKHGTFIRIQNEKYRSALRPGIVSRLRKVFAPRLGVPPAIRKKTPKKYFYDEMIISFNDEELTASGPFYTIWEDPKSKAAQKKVRSDELDEEESEEALEEEENPSKGAQLEPALDPRYERELQEIPQTTIGGKSVYGRAALIDRGMHHNSRYGFDLIKNGRVIELYVKDKDKKNKQVGLLASPHNSRIIGQLFLDAWDTDHQKTEFMKDSAEWNAIADYVREHIKPLIGISRALQHPNRGKAEDETIEEKKAVEYLPKLRSGITTAARSSEVKETLEAIDKKPREKNKRTDKPHKPTKSNTSLLFTTPDLGFAHKGADSPMVTTKSRIEGRTHILKVTLNLDHPFLEKRESGELKAIGQFLTVDCFAEYMFHGKGLEDHDDFLKIRESLLLKFKS